MCAVRERWAKQEAGTFKVRIAQETRQSITQRSLLSNLPLPCGRLCRLLGLFFDGALARNRQQHLALARSALLWLLRFLSGLLYCIRGFGREAAFQRILKLTTFGAGAAMRSVGTDMPALLR